MCHDLPQDPTICHSETVTTATVSPDQPSSGSVGPHEGVSARWMCHHVSVTSPDDLLTQQQVADLFQVHINTVQAWTADDYLPCIRLGPRGRTVRYRRSEIERILSERECVNNGT